MTTTEHRQIPHDAYWMRTVDGQTKIERKKKNQENITEMWTEKKKKNHETRTRKQRL